jgi:hypothetical protein
MSDEFRSQQQTTPDSGAANVEPGAPPVLGQTPAAPGAAAPTATAPNPNATQAQFIQVQPGQNVDLSSVMTANASVAMQGRDLVITRPDAPPVVVQNFLAAANAALPAAVTLGNGVVVQARELITVTQQIGSATVSDVIGSRVAQVAPAAAAPAATQTAAPSSTTSHTSTTSTSAPVSVSTGNNDTAGVRSQAQTTARGEVGAAAATPAAAVGDRCAPARRTPAGG